MLEDWRADPSDQADIMDGGRLSSHVFQLAKHVNEKGPPEMPEAVRIADEAAKAMAV